MAEVQERVELWDLSARTLIEVLSTEAAERRLLVDDDTLFLLGDRDVLVLEVAIDAGEYSA